MIDVYRDTATNALTDAPADGREYVGTYGELINWQGGDCPVPPDTEVIAYFRGRRPYLGPAIWPDMPASAKPFIWHHAPMGKRTDPKADIVAYRVKVE